MCAQTIDNTLFYGLGFLSVSNYFSLSSSLFPFFSLYLYYNILLFQLVKADTTDADFQTLEMKCIFRRLDESLKKIRTRMLQHMTLVGNKQHIKDGLKTYDDLVKAMIKAKPQCVLEGMANLSSNAYTNFMPCLPDKATLQAKMDEGKQVLDALFNELKAVDEEIRPVSDPVIRAEMAAQADANYAGDFYLKMTNYIFSNMGTVQQCIEKAGRNLRDTVLENINSMAQCYTPQN